MDLGQRLHQLHRLLSLANFINGLRSNNAWTQGMEGGFFSFVNFHGALD